MSERYPKDPIDGGLAALTHAWHDSENTTRPTEDGEQYTYYEEKAFVLNTHLNRLGYKIVKND